jgi:RNA polymerase sigma factor (sigma-70 family)
MSTSDRQSRVLFEALVREHAESVLLFLVSAMRDRASAEDVLQESITIAWKHLATYDPTRPFGAWLRGIARLQMLSHWRRTRPTQSFDERFLDHIEQRVGYVHALAGDSLMEKAGPIRDCVNKLPPQFASPIRLVYWEGLSLEDAARSLTEEYELVKKRLQRARSMLSECLRRAGVLPLGDEPALARQELT